MSTTAPPRPEMARRAGEPEAAGKRRVLLILPTQTYRAHDFIEAARRLGVQVAVASDRRQPLADVMADRSITIDMCDPERAAEAIVVLDSWHPLDAVVAVDDEGVLVASIASRRLGLPHNDPVAVARTRDKSAMRDAFSAAGVPQPRYRRVDPGDDVAKTVGDVGLPCVVKPVSLSASRGVIRADTPREADAAAKRIRAILSAAGEDPSGRLLVESFVPGDEIAVEGLLRAGVLEVLAIFDKPDPLDGPYFEETIYVTPSRLPPVTQDAVRELTAEAAKALGLTEGPVHAEVRVGSPERLVVLELAARSIGGLCSRTLRFGIGVSLEEVILRHALGLPLGRLKRTTGASGVMMLPIPARGTLERVDGVDDARAVPGVAGVEITIPPGGQVVPLPEGDRYLGFLFGVGDTPGDVEDSLRAAHRRLVVTIAPI